MVDLARPLRPVVHIVMGFTLLSSALTTYPQMVEASTIPGEVNGLIPSEQNRSYPETAYTLGAGDRIRVEILKLSQYSGEYEVLINGTLNLTQIGSVSVEGMTLEEAAIAIANRYTSARILRKPQVTVSLLTPRPLKIGIAGEVNRPGSYIIAVERSQFPSVTQALQLAGGVTQTSDLRRVRIERPRTSGNREIIDINLWELIQTGNLANDITLRDGDIIFIPTADRIDPAESSQLVSATFSLPQTQPINVAILGEVGQPGTHILPPGIQTVTQAIKLAGGIKPLADIRTIQINRIAKTGFEQTIEIDLWKLLQAGDLQQDLLLQNGDTVIVPTLENIDLAESSQLRGVSFAASNISQPLNITVVGEVYRPGAYTVTGSARTGEAGVPGGAAGSDSFPTVIRAIQIAGGIKPLANIRQIQIRRFTSMGEERTIEVDLWQLLQVGDSTQDIVLQQGDTIIIPTADQLDPNEAEILAAANFAPNSIRVNVVGEVRNPGLVEVPPNTPLNQAILAVGGFSRQRANKGTVELIRLNSNGTVSKKDIPINMAMGINEENNPTLRNNDIIIVNRNFFTAATDTLNTLLSPIGSALGIASFINLFK
jgi:polysaccharide export outer membrane protein